MARSRELWLWAGASLVTADAALGGVAGALAAARPGYDLWPGAPMVGVYAASALALACFGAAVRDWRFPFAADRSGRVAGVLAWGGPPTVGWVDRSELVVVVSALTAESRGSVALTTGLVGAGGFGKTMLAARACQDRAVRRRFPGGVCWITVGRDLDGEALAQRISEAVWNLDGEGPAFASLEEAGHALARALAAKPPMLLVADDVWTGSQLTPFVTAGQAVRLLITTRRPAVLAGTGARSVEVDAVPREVARRILARDLPPISSRIGHDLLRLAGGWPLLLSLMNRRLAEELGRPGASIDAAAREAAERLRRNGPAALDIKDAQSRRLAVATTISYSLDTLDVADRDRFCQLGIFAEDAEIPLPLIAALWQATTTEAMSEAEAVVLCERLAGLSLVSLAWAGDQKVMVIHDVIRDLARSMLGPERVAELNGMLLAAAAAALVTATRPGTDDVGPTVAWWELGIGGGYLHGQLIWHLIEAGDRPEAEALACDLRWAGSRLAQSGPAAIAADLGLVGTPRAARMAVAVIRAAHLLGPAEPTGAVVDTLHSRLGADPDWGPQVAALKATSPRLRLTNRWQPPDLPSPALHAVLEGHQDAVNGVCAVMVADRQLLATTSDDQTVRIWDPATGAQLRVLDGHQDWVRGVCAVMVADRQLLATASGDGTVRIWDPATGAQIRVLDGHGRAINGICAVTVADRQLLASTSNQLVASTSTWEGTVRIWDPATGAERALLEGHGRAIRGICAVTVSGCELLAGAGDDGKVRIWDPATGAQHVVLEGDQRWVNNLCAVTVADRKLLATASWDGTVRIWDPATGVQRAVLEGHQGGVLGVCAVTVGSRELLATASRDGTVRIWDPAIGAEQAALKGHQNTINAVCTVAVAAGRELLATAGGDGRVRIWDPVTGAQRGVLEGHQGAAFGGCSVTLAGRELLATVGGDGTRIWEPATAQHPAPGRDQRSVNDVYTATVADRERVATTSGDETAEILDSAAIAQAALRNRQNWVFGVCGVMVAGRQLLATANDDRTVRIWEPATGVQQAVLQGHLGTVFGVCAVTVADHQLLASAGGDGTVRIWDPSSGIQRAVLEGHRDWVRGVCAVMVADHQLLASAGGDGTVRIWEPTTGVQQAVLQGHLGTVFGVCAVTVADRQLLASVGGDRTVRIWDPATGQAQALIRVDRPLLACAPIPSEGLAAAGEGGLYGFDISPAAHPGR